MDKTHATRISNTVFFTHKYLTHPTIIPAYAILASASDMAEQLRGHHTRHLGADQLHNLKNLHSIFANAATTNATNAPTPRNTQTSDYGVLALQAGDATGPNLDAVTALPSVPRPDLTPALPSRVITLPRATLLQVSPFPRVEQDRLTAQAPDTAPDKGYQQPPLPHGEAAVEAPKAPERCQNGGATYNDATATSHDPGSPQGQPSRQG